LRSRKDEGHGVGVRRNGTGKASLLRVVILADDELDGSVIRRCWDAVRASFLLDGSDRAEERSLGPQSSPPSRKQGRTPTRASSMGAPEGSST
jgi:hypothetical protein